MRECRLQVYGVKIRARPRENRAPPNTSSREAVEDLPVTSSGAQCGWYGWRQSSAPPRRWEFRPLHVVLLLDYYVDSVRAETRC